MKKNSGSGIPSNTKSPLHGLGVGANRLESLVKLVGTTGIPCHFEVIVSLMRLWSWRFKITNDKLDMYLYVSFKLILSHVLVTLHGVLLQNLPAVSNDTM